MRALLTALLLTSLCAHAADIDSMAVRYAAESPALRAEKARISAELGEARDANILEGPEAEFEYKFGPEENRWGVSVGQGFDWPGVYAARRQANDIRSTALGRLYESRLVDRAVEIKQAILRYCRARGLRDIYADIQANFELMKNTYSDALRRGECTILDLRRVEVECFKAVAEGREAESELRAAAFDLRALGDDALAEEAKDYVYVLTAPRPYSVYEEALEAKNPEIAYYKDLARLADAEMKVARRGLLPSFKVSFIHDFEEGTHFNGFGVGISLPTWSGKHKLAAARGNAVASVEALADYRLLASSKLYADYERAGSLYATVVDAASTFGDGEYLNLLKKALDAGKITLYEYLADYLEYCGAKVTYLNLLYDYADTDARLSRYTILP